jgi:chromosome segregation ATPase
MLEKTLSGANSQGSTSMRAIVESIKAARQQRAHLALERKQSIQHLKSETKLLLQNINDLREQIRKENVQRKKQTEAMLSQYETELRQSVQQLLEQHRQFMVRLQIEHNQLRQELKAKATELKAGLKANEQKRMEAHRVLMSQIHQFVQAKQDEVQRIKDTVRELRRQAAAMVTAYANKRREDQAIWAELSGRALASTAKVDMPKPTSEPSEIERQFAISIPFVKQKK